MKAAILKGIDMPLVVESVATPALGANDVLVKLKAASLNKRDWWIQKGQYAGLKFPIVLGSDGAGIVDAVGANVDKSLMGKEVVIYPGIHWGDNERGFTPQTFSILGLPDDGCLAEYVKINAENVFPKPAQLSFEETAALPVAGLTAFRALFIRGQWQKGERVLISGVGGGAGSFALQWALAAGAEVWVTSGSEKKIEKAIQLGAKGGVRYTAENWEKELQAKAGDFDVIIDSALGDGFAKLVSLAAPGGRIVFFGGTGGNIPALNGRAVFWKQISILGTSLGSPKNFETMLKFVSDKKIHPIIDNVFSLNDAEKAMRTMDTHSDKFGKTVLKID